jgi:hypothetical protein
MSASLSRLRSFYGELKAPLLLHAMIKREFGGSIAVLTSAKTASEILLRMIAKIDATLPVLWLESGGNDSLPRRLGFGRIICIKDAPSTLATTLEDMALLAIICDDNRSESMPRIELDADGVFRIYPLAPDRQSPHNADWSV